MFSVEFMVTRYDEGFGHSHDVSDVESAHKERHQSGLVTPVDQESLPTEASYPPGGDTHYSHAADHKVGFAGGSALEYSAQLTGLMILEFGVIFHSFLIGLALSGTDEIKILTAVLAVHQCLEGLGLGSRLATSTWPSGWKSYTPWVMAWAYALTTPLAIAIGLGVKESLQGHPDRALLANGVFDALSAGVLLYVGLVELLGHELLYNPEMRRARIQTPLAALACIALGMALMSTLAIWA